MFNWLFAKYRIQWEAYSGTDNAYWSTDYDVKFYTQNGAIKYILNLLNKRLKNGATSSRYRIIDSTAEWPRTKVVAAINVKYYKKSRKVSSSIL